MVAADRTVYSLGMSLSNVQRRELLKQSHHLKAVATFSARSLGPGTVEHIRQILTRHDVAKVRISADTAAECDLAAETLAAQVPCDLVGRIGRIVILHRIASDSAAGAS